MKQKLQVIGSWLTVSAASLVALFYVSSCQNNKDLYNSTSQQKQYEEAFTQKVLNGESIDPNQTWNASEMTSLKINVDLDATATYTINIFTANPLYDANATLLATGTVVSGNALTLKFAKPQAMTTLYVAAVNAKNRFTVTAINVTDDNEEVTIGGTLAQETRTRTLVNSERTDREYYLKEESEFLDPSVIDGNTYYDVTTIPTEDLGEIDKKHNYSPIYGDGKHYEIPAGKTFDGKLRLKAGSYSGCVILVRGTWNMSNEKQSYDNGLLIVIEKGGKLVINQDLTFVSGAGLINKGTIESANSMIYIENPGKFYNSGIISLGNGGFSISGNEIEFYNCGDMTMKYLDVRGECKFVNMKSLIAESTTKNKSTLEEQRTAASTFKLISCCHTQIGALGVKTLVVCDNGRIDCSTGIYTSGGSNGTVTMGKFAVVKTKDWIDNGGKFYGANEEKEASIFQFTGTAVEQNINFSVSGYLFFDGTNFSSDWGSQQIIEKKLITYTCTEETCPISIPKGDCTGGGYNPKNEEIPPVVTTPTSYLYAFEDMGTIGDFDFNDVVLAVKYPVVDANGKKTAQVVVLAAGGTLPVAVKLGGQKICEEVHAKFGMSTSTMINTGGTTAAPVVLYTIENPGDTFDASNLDLTIVVNGTTSKEISSITQAGSVPQMIKVPGTWQWPKEKVNISDAYATEGHSFAGWAVQYNTNTDWYRYPIEGKTLVIN